ncbi:MAG TPA: MFS transporter [Opitutaceae bacterium]|nr:MFS transporter [Opitutaceae bacterium]HRJ47284.1 MFS transporter [Opitutaceae bacterium]
MPAKSRPAGFRRALALLALVLAGETVFFLPFVLARIFRPTLLEVFDLTNVQLGAAFSLYGMVGMAAYFFGGPLADRFAPRLLLTVALVTTAAGGLLLAGNPSLTMLKWIYAYWGFTTIALFWSALIKATREWGGESLQGAAFGLLDGGRGLVTAVTGTFAVAIYASLLPAAVETASFAQRADAFRQIILIMTGLTCASAVFLWFTLPREKQAAAGKPAYDFGAIKRALRLPAVWLQALIVVCAYVGFKATDDFSLYAKEVLGFNEVDAARLGLVSLWMRPIGAIGAGLLADRLSAGRMTMVSFVLIAMGAAALATGMVGPGTVAVFLLGIVTASLGIFALRGLYYAIMGEARIPLTITGAAVGVVSVIGYTPDVFMGPLMGWLLDGTPGAGGHRQVFAVVAAFAVAGLGASWWFMRLTRGSPTNGNAAN